MTDLISACYPHQNKELLTRASECWNSFRDFRDERERCKRFTYGEQWKDLIEDRGIKMSEEEFIRNQGNMPLKNNLIRRLVRNVLGVFRNQWKEPVWTPAYRENETDVKVLNSLLQSNMRLNRLEELYARTMEEFLISGLAVHKKWYGRRDGLIDCWTELVRPSSFFIDHSSIDFRGSDISLIGEIHNLVYEDLCATFARSRLHADALASIYGVHSINDRTTFCMVFEVWHRSRPLVMNCHDLATGRWFKLDAEMESCVIRENERRLMAKIPLIRITWTSDEQWNYTFLTPDGIVLDSGRSPYGHAGHPYIYKAYPFIDGEIHSFVSDVIDQQKLTNRLISMYDWILRASAKGVLLFPEGSLPDGVDINDIADEWSRFNGVIVYRPRVGVPLPQQVSSKSVDIGITQLLEIQMKMMEDISGVNGALQGKLDSNSMSGTLYDQQTRNSMTALTDLLKSFDDFIHTATEADVANIRRFYKARFLEQIQTE